MRYKRLIVPHQDFAGAGRARASGHGGISIKAMLCLVSFICLLGVLPIQGCGNGIRELPELTESLDAPGGDEPGVRAAPLYSVNYGDRLNVYFHGVPDLSGEVGVRADGFCTFKRIGDLEVVGLSLQELTGILENQFSNYYIDPEITVSLLEKSMGRFFVLGEVARPGSYILEDGLTLLGGIASSGGWKNSASLGSIVLLRSRDPEPPDAYRLDIERALTGRAPEVDPFLFPSDIVYVPETLISRVDGFVDVLFGDLLPPVDSILRGYYYLNMVDIREEELDLIESGQE